MAKSEIIECKLPKGRKWSDPNVIKELSPYCGKYSHKVYAPYGKYCLFYPIGHDLYVKGMFHRYENKKRVNISVKLVNYKNLTGIEAWNILSGKVISESMILDAWNKLGLRLGFMTPILKDLN